jgi:hypothetical protein
MRELRRLAWAAAFAAFAATPAAAQTTAGTTGTTVGSSGTTLQTAATSGNTQGNVSGNSGQAGNNLGQSGGTALTAFPKSPNIAAVTAYGTTNSTNTGVQQSNFLRNTYANPYYMGRYNVTATQAPGGFGAVLYPVTGTTGTTGGRGGQGGVGATGTSGSINVQDPGGIIANLPRQIAYTSVVKFQPPPMVAGQLQADLSGMISRATMLANPAGVQVTTEGQNVTLRGAVQSSEEARMVEGMVRMTPGVRQIKNELTYPKP